jgi:hypothetical protein
MRPAVVATAASRYEEGMSASVAERGTAATSPRGSAATAAAAHAGACTAPATERAAAVGR